MTVFTHQALWALIVSATKGSQAQCFHSASANPRQNKSYAKSVCRIQWSAIADISALLERLSFIHAASISIDKSSKSVVQLVTDLCDKI